MTPEEAKKNLMSQAGKDVSNLHGILDEFRINMGISYPIFIELLATVLQEYRLMFTLLGKK